MALADHRARAESGCSLGRLTETLSTTTTKPAAGLSEAEARRLLAERGPPPPPATSRSTRSIVVANVFTFFNAILLVLGVLTLVFGDWRDALFLGIIVANSGIGIAQELRAKAALDRLAALVAPDATVVRDGEPRKVAVDEVLPGDVVRVQAGDQVVADGVLASSEALALDESILTGESALVPRGAGDELRSGSFAAEGAGTYLVEAVGADSYAQRIAGEAREFRHPRSPLERAINRLLFVLVGIMIPLGTILVYSLRERDVEDGVTVAVAGIVTLVPEGLVLLASLTFAAAALQLTRRGALAQQLNAIESLASVDVLCLDKTGTLTEPTLRVVAVEPAQGVEREELADALGRFAASSPARNATLSAIAAAHAGVPEQPSEHAPFSSKRRWSGLRLGDRRYVLGAPELFPLDLILGGRAAKEAGAGRRVLAFGTTEQPLAAEGDGTPGTPTPLGLVVLSEELRPQARETVEFFQAEGVELKVLSGDSPDTVAAIARDAGIPVERVVDASHEAPTIEATVVGRISPDGKRQLVEELRARGRYVAMVGDGVNDVPALKAARLAIVQGSGSEMARSVADVVLVHDDFAAVPAMVAEGRKILRNVQRVAKLFVTKSAFAAFLILLIGTSPETPYPLLPRHLTLAATLTIGVPGFFLALAPSSGPWRTERFLREIARFAIPAGTAAGLGVLAAYRFALDVTRLPLEEAQTVATSVLIVVGLYLVLALEASGRRRAIAVGALCAGLLALYVAVLAVAGFRDFFALVVPGVWGWIAIPFGAGLTIAGLMLTDERFVPAVGREHPSTMDSWP